jgi:hypothetical protein
VALKIIRIRNVKKHNILWLTAFIAVKRDTLLGTVQQIKRAYTEKEDLALDVDQSGIF